MGRFLVTRLIARGERVRVMTRQASPPAGFDDANVEIVRGDVRDAGSLTKALKNVDLVVSAVQGFAGPGGVSPDSVDRRGNFNLIDAAAKANADFVLMSVVGASPDSRMELFRAKFATEEYLKQSGVPWTIVRATAFMETWAMVMGESLLRTGKTMVFGRGENPINFVSAFDVAALLDRVVDEPHFRARIIEIGGSRNLTFDEFAEQLQHATGRSAKVNHIPRPMLRAMALIMRLPQPALARQAGAAVVMDTADMRFDASVLRREMPDLPDTDLGSALSRYFHGIEGRVPL